MLKTLNWAFIVTSSIIFFEYVVLMTHKFGLFDSEQDTFVKRASTSWSNWVFDHLCYSVDEYNQDCVNDWSNWVSIGEGSIRNSFFIIEFIMLILSYTSEYAIIGTGILREDQFLEDPEFKDEDDFMSRNTTNYKAGRF